jgi:hypothetical protein
VDNTTKMATPHIAFLNFLEKGGPFINVPGPLADSRPVTGCHSLEELALKNWRSSTLKKDGPAYMLTRLSGASLAAMAK